MLEQFFKKQTMDAKYWLLGRDSSLKFFLTSDQLHGEAYTGSWLKMQITLWILKKKSKPFYKKTTNGPGRYWLPKKLKVKISLYYPFKSDIPPPQKKADWKRMGMRFHT